MSGRRVTVVIHVDGDLASRQYRLPLWVFDVGRWGAVVVVLLVVLFFAFAEPLAQAAARVPGLEREVARLDEENARVARLATELNHAEAHYQELRDLLSPRAPTAPLPGPEPMRAPPVVASPVVSPPRYETGPSAPTHWPLAVAGFVTRGQVARPDSGGETHAGIDIAVPLGSAVRAAGGGLVETAGMDSAYGLYVLVRHPNGYETLYGHASRLLVHDGDSVTAGQVIALSGNSGRSTAPHLHFEIRRDGAAIDPLTLVAQEN
ncbi:MAG TPA: peptidoglycan DD-metalloendopeptidase family protein [Gemmatimonadales bacterium]|nr:peptidoglycan DD-metalloendopeptidase family protein [Gemmatimonadales bacterium]